MAIEPRPRVAIIGGFFNLDANPKLGQEAREYTKALGHALAGAGFGLVVYFSTTSLWSPTLCVGSWLRYLLASLDPVSTCATRKTAWSGEVRGTGHQNDAVSRGRFSRSELGGPVLSFPRGTRRRGRCVADGWGSVHP